MKTSKNHICIVSDQRLANVIPILQLEPEYVTLVVSDDMKPISEQLKSFLKIYRKNTTVIEKTGLPTDSIESIQEFCLNLITDLKDQLPNTELIYNVTGGSKLMAIAFMQFAKDFDDIIYTDTATHHILRIKEMPSSAVDMISVLDINSYFKAQGKTVRDIKSDVASQIDIIKKRLKVTNYLAKNAEVLEHFIGEINQKVKSAVEERNNKIVITQPQQQFNQPVKKQKFELLQLFKELDIIQWDESSPQKFYLHRTDTIRYLTGEWLEEYAYFCAVNSGADYIGWSVQFTDDSEPKADIRNELDVVVLHNNVVLIIECKTMKFGFNANKDSNTIYQMDSIKKGAGTFAKSVLLSARPLDHETKAGKQVAVEARARSAAIEPLVGSQLKQLTQKIKETLAIKSS